MLKSISIFVVIFLFYSIPSRAQNIKQNFFYKKTLFETAVTAEAVKNNILEGNSIGIKSSFHLTPNTFGLFFGGEAFAIKSGSSISIIPLIENSSKTVIGGFGVTIGMSKLGTRVVNDTRINYGFTHISQAGNLLLPDLFGYLKLSQIQNDWLTYFEFLTETNINQNGLNRFIFGIRYEIPISSLAQASVNGMEIKIPAANRRNLQAWVEIGLVRLVIKNSWAVSLNFRSGYRYIHQNQLNLLQPGVVISIHNLYSEVIRINYYPEFDPKKNIKSLHHCSLTVNIIDLGRGF